MDNNTQALVSITQTIMRNRKTEPSLGTIARAVGEISEKLFPSMDRSDENAAIIELCRRYKVERKTARKSDLQQLKEDEASEREGLRLMGAGE